MRLACDTGGTFTDLLVEEADGAWFMTKASTVAHDPGQGVIDAMRKAADFQGRPLANFLARAEILIHGTTHALNAVLTGGAAKTALLVTRGHRDVLTLREGGRTGPFAFDLPYPKAYVPRALTFEVAERIDSTGAVVTPLNQAALRQICARLREERIEAIGVCLLWSIVNPDHERIVGNILAEELPGVPVTLSHVINSTMREYRRASAAAIDASLKPIMSRYLGTLEARLRAEGFAGQLLVTTSQGGMLPAADVGERPILSINSGPSMAPVAGRWYGQKIDPTTDVIVTDTGGTTFDVSLVRDGRIPVTRETWVGGAHQGPMTGFPSVDVRSVGAGGGSLASVDSGGLLKVGPQSAGAWPGPACYGRGGERPTLSDAALILGILSAENFLGGAMPLNVEAAKTAMRIHVAEPLGVTVVQAAAMVLKVATETMAQAILDLLFSQGVDPRKALLLVGGGAAGMNAVYIARRLGCRTLVVPEAGAALSATGAMLSELMREVRVMQFQTTRAFDSASARAAFAALTAECEAFALSTGLPQSSISYSAEARYPDQVWELDLPLPRVDFPDGAHKDVEAAFHTLHQRIFAVCDPESEVEIIGLAASVSCRARTAAAPHLILTDAKPTRRRPVTLQDGLTQEADVHDYAALAVGEYWAGPAIVEMPLTTVVIDRDARFFRSDTGSLLVELNK